MGQSLGGTRRATVIVCLGLFGLLLMAAPAFAAPAAGWLPQASGTTADLRDVALTGQHGWAVGAGGTLITTADGGSTWAPLATGYSDGFFAVAFPDLTHGWLAGGAILGTGDGAAWTVQVAATSSLAAIDAVDATHAWAVGGAGQGSQVVATIDGATWAAQTTPQVGRLAGVDAVDRTHVWAVGSGGAIIGTADGGATWHVQHTDPALKLTAVSFIDQSRGWAAGFTGSGLFGARAVLLATDDGGATWTARHVAVAQSFFADVVRRDELHGWAVGCYASVTNAVFSTADGGATWRLTAVAPKELAAIAGDDGGGCAVGGAGTVLVTNGQDSPDVTAPVSDVTGAGAGWRTKWTLRLTADDDAAGVAQRQFSTDSLGRWARGARLVLTSGTDHAFDGTHRIYYRSVDAAGNIETPRSVKVRIDTRRPVTHAARSVAVAGGAVASVPYSVTDRKPCAGWVSLKVQIIAGDADGNEHVVKVVRVARVSVGARHVLRLRCDLAPGVYICSIIARDAAGNMGGGNSTVLRVQ
jgi:photosystem II stability/assembly factor-like uncharacterized protein